MQKVYIYYAEISRLESLRTLYPKERMEEINECKSESVRLEKYCAWNLLKHAVVDAFSLVFDNLQFTKMQSGQWVCDQCNFSISHSDGVVAVVVSNFAIGIDIEPVKRLGERLAGKVLTELELERYSELSDEVKAEFLLECWCKKEAIFKSSGGSVLLPRTIECDNYHTALERVSIDGREYVIAIAASEEFEIKKLSNIN